MEKGLSEVKKFSGLSINSGKVSGTACLYSIRREKATPDYALGNDQEVAADLARFEEALLRASQDLEAVAAEVGRNVGMAEAEIFITQKHIMTDASILKDIRTGIAGRKKNAEAIVSEVFNGYEKKFQAFTDSYLRERSSDISEIRTRLINELRGEKAGFICHGQKSCLRGENRIIVAETLTAEMMMNMNYEKVLGFVTEHGGITSHAAILARSLGVPAVTGLRGVLDHILCGSEILIDGDTGTVYVNPDRVLIETLVPPPTRPNDTVCILATPTGMEVLANASFLEDVKMARTVRADGIGLFRTEMMFLKADRLLSEDEQFDYYSQVQSQMENRPVTFRLLDIGGDKPLSFLRIEQEANPYLGWRGARFLLGNPDIFSMQVRALARLSRKCKVRIMVPMVVDVVQQQKINEAILSVLPTVDAVAENILIGAMFEVPSACILADEIFKVVDFGSIGSNDLIQYLFAVDRNNEQVSQDYNPEHPILWSILESLSAAAKRTGKPLSICGEMAGRDAIPTRLVKIGITSLSVSPRLIPQVRTEMVQSMEKSTP